MIGITGTSKLETLTNIHVNAKALPVVNEVLDKEDSVVELVDRALDFVLCFDQVTHRFQILGQCLQF